MTTKTALVQNSSFKIGWIILVIFTALMTLNHIALIFNKGDGTLAIGYAIFNLYALIVILIPFRKFERWAWLTTWILPIGLVLPAMTVSNSVILILYSTVSALLVLGLLLTMRDFFPKVLNG